MKYILLFIIKVYWKIIPELKRGKCIYRRSCSHYVFDTTMERGLIEGLKALNYRFRTCNQYFQLYKNPMTSRTEGILSNGDTLTENEIADRLIENG